MRKKLFMTTALAVYASLSANVLSTQGSIMIEPLLNDFPNLSIGELMKIRVNYEVKEKAEEEIRRRPCPELDLKAIQSNDELSGLKFSKTKEEHSKFQHKSIFVKRNGKDDQYDIHSVSYSSNQGMYGKSLMEVIEDVGIKAVDEELEKSAKKSGENVTLTDLVTKDKYKKPLLPIKGMNKGEICTYETLTTDGEGLGGLKIKIYKLPPALRKVKK